MFTAREAIRASRPQLSAAARQSGGPLLDYGADRAAQRQIATAINNSPHSLQLKSIAAGLQGGPRARQQKAFANGLTNGPVAAAQQMQMKSLFAPVRQMRQDWGSAPTPRATHNPTGLPDQLKSGVEALSGVSLDGVRVHYNSPQPATINALAYAQGQDIHLAPGQEKHLPHEAWHITQQAQGRVKPTMQLRTGVPVNDDEYLEKEADAMGSAALHASPAASAPL